MGYAKGMSHGFAIGLAIGVLTAPRAGRETREKLIHSLVSTKERTQQVSGKLQQGWQIAQPALDRAGQAAGDLARAVQPVAQGASDRFVELAGRAEREVPPPVPGFDHPS
ncbi:MAG TPA: YtxH domain-containing protein [Candidatus Dormibacteraeota bacterium]|nr:YtxH domain-containing protein [Candidatus Dormibacteraeota bacterium]